MTGPRLEGARFHLRGLVENDLPGLVAVASSPGFFAYVDVPERLRQAYGLQDARAFLAEAQGAWRQGLPTWGIIGRDGLVGTARIRRAPWGPYDALGYGLAPSARGQGIATATVRRILAWCAEDARPPPHARCAPRNLASEAVLLRSGFLRVGTDPAHWSLWRPPDASPPAPNAI